MKSVKKTFGILTEVILVIFIISQLIMFVSWETALKGSHDPSVFGFTRTVVMSGSMEPTIPVGSMAITMKQDTYEVGDVIMYWNSDYNLYILHRIVEDTPNGFITQGDANERPDSQFVKYDQIVGKCIFFSAALGKFMALLGRPWVIPALVVILVLIDFSVRRVFARKLGDSE